MPNSRGDVWTLAEVRDGAIHSVSWELLAWGRKLADKLGSRLASVVLGSGVTHQTDSLIRHGADVVYVVDEPELATYRPDAYNAVLVSLVKEYKPEIFIASATTTGRTVMPVLYVDLETGLTADCTGLDIDPETKLLLQTRPAIGGNVMADIRTPNTRPQMCTVRPRSKRPLAPDANRRGEVIVKRGAAADLASIYQFLSFDREKAVGLPIQDAEIIVAGGKGMKNPKNFALLEELARRLGGSVGASRQAVDLSWAPYSAQVGLSGKSVTPKIYIACGISGAVQHLAGMSAADTVIAINTDPDAPIFRVADLGIIGNAMEIVPKLIDMCPGGCGRKGGEAR